MKKLTEMVNPFILLLVPVMVVVLLGMSYQFQQHVYTADVQATEQAVPLFYKGVHLIKAICTVTQENVW